MGAKNRSSSKKTIKSSSKRKRSTEGREKRRKEKSRKRFDSDSDSDGSGRNLSTSSSSSFSSERKRTRSRSKVRHEKKRKRRISSSPSSSDEDSSPVKKRRKSRRRDSDTNTKSKRKMKMKKKKSKRHSSLSSSSSEEYGGRRRRRRSRPHKSETKDESRPMSMSRSRSRSVSSSYSADSISSSEQNDIPSYRLKSVITVGNPYLEEENKDGANEELVYDHDDYPPCKSNDSNEGCKREMDSSKFAMSEPSSHEDGGEDLESLLRKKALENLRKRCNMKAKTSMNLEQADHKSGTAAVKVREEEHPVVDYQESQNLDANKYEAHKDEEIIKGTNGPSSTSLPSSSLTTTAPQVPNSKEEKKDDGKEEEEASEFVQKTINRMVNGEMVQVSYTVRKPQPRALARRQLRR